MSSKNLTKTKTILGIETSCDETAAAVVQNANNRLQLLSNIVASSAQLQSKYGGVIPEQAAREQLKSILPVIKEALEQAQIKPEDIDAIAVTEGPGLIGSLLVGVETAKTLSLVWNKPLIPINHLIAHFYANWIEISDALEEKFLNNKGVENESKIYKKKNIIPHFPAIGLLISGGHTDLLLMKDHGDYQYLGGTRDDAAGEAFDKTARLLDLPYPGGPNLSKLAQKGDPNAFQIPRPMIESNDYDFSFSGLKTSVLYNIEKLPKPLQEKQKENLAASIEAAIVDVLVKKTVKAAKDFNIDHIIVAGGVASNQNFRKQLRENFKGKISIPPPYLCTDNAAMVAAAAFYNYKPTDPLNVQANPNLTLMR